MRKKEIYVFEWISDNNVSMIILAQLTAAFASASAAAATIN
jgi:hypothetical protein